MARNVWRTDSSGLPGNAELITAFRSAVRFSSLDVRIAAWLADITASMKMSSFCKLLEPDASLLLELLRRLSPTSPSTSVAVFQAAESDDQ